MSEVSPEAPVASKFDPEAFAMNLAKAMESGGQALAAYLDVRDVVADLAELLPGETWHKLVARLHLDHFL